MEMKIDIGKSVVLIPHRVSGTVSDAHQKEEHGSKLVL